MWQMLHRGKQQCRIIELYQFFIETNWQNDPTIERYSYITIHPTFRTMLTEISSLGATGNSGLFCVDSTYLPTGNLYLLTPIF
jgi:hypothetical protein